MSELPAFGARAQALIASQPGVEDRINPANSQAERLESSREMRTRIPMSIPRAKMATPEIPGYHCHWVNDYPGRIMQAQQAGYEFMTQEEALITMTNPASDSLGGGTGLGSRVSIVVGKDDSGKALEAYLMKIRLEWYKEDQLAVQGRVDQIHDAMRQGLPSSGGDNANRYVSRNNMKSTYSAKG